MVDFTPLAINDIIDTRSDMLPNAFDELLQHPPYQSIHHTLARQQSTARWTLHAYRGFHQPLLFGHLNKDARVWVKIVTHSIFPCQHFSEVTRDRVCLVYALMSGMELNVGSVVKSAMRKARTHKGRRYAFGGIITKLCLCAGVPTDDFNYCPHIEASPYIVTSV